MPIIKYEDIGGCAGEVNSDDIAQLQANLFREDPGIHVGRLELEGIGPNIWVRNRQAVRAQFKELKSKDAWDGFLTG